MSPTQHAIRPTPTTATHQPPSQLQMPTSSSPRSTQGIVSYTGTASNSNNNPAMTVMALGLTNINLQEANEVLSNAFSYPSALTETAKNKGYGFRTVQREEWHHNARGADPITMRTCTRRDFVIHSKNKKGEPYGLKKEETETPGVMQIIRPAAAPQRAPPANTPTYTYQPAFNAGIMSARMPTYQQQMMPRPI